MSGKKVRSFVPWKPESKRVFNSAFAFEIKTTPVDPERAWETPDYIFGVAFDGTKGYFVTREHVACFLAVHQDLMVVIHGAPVALAVLDKIARDELDVYDLVHRDQVRDTQLLQQLYLLGTRGLTAQDKDEATLESCAKKYLKLDLSGDSLDADCDPIRTSWHKYVDVPPGKIDSRYLEAIAQDVIAVYRLHRHLEKLLDKLLAESTKVWGYVSDRWRNDVVRLFGHQTHHTQLRGAIALFTVTANGLHVDGHARTEVTNVLKSLLRNLREHLIQGGWDPEGPDAKGNLQTFLGELEQRRGLKFPRTRSGKVSTAADALHDIAIKIPEVQNLLRYQQAQSLLGSFLGKMDRPVLHPSFDGMARTGRTTSHGEINAQNLPRTNDVRRCIVPSPGHVFILADYKTIELVTLGQALLKQFGMKSATPWAWGSTASSIMLAGTSESD